MSPGFLISLHNCGPNRGCSRLQGWAHQFRGRWRLRIVECFTLSSINTSGWIRYMTSEFDIMNMFLPSLRMQMGINRCPTSSRMCQQKCSTTTVKCLMYPDRILSTFPSFTGGSHSELVFSSYRVSPATGSASRTSSRHLPHLPVYGDVLVQRRLSTSRASATDLPRRRYMGWHRAEV